MIPEHQLERVGGRVDLALHPRDVLEISTRTGPSDASLRAVDPIRVLRHHAVSRRFEFEADAGAALLTGDLAGAVSYNATLARLGALPSEWGLLTRLLSTHPSPARRIAALEKAGAPADGLAGAIDTSARYAEEAALGAASRVHSTPLLLVIATWNKNRLHADLRKTKFTYRFN